MSMVKSRISKAVIEKLLMRGTGFVTFFVALRSLESEVMGGYILSLSLFFYAEIIREGVIKTALVKFTSGADKKTTQNFYNGAFWAGLVISLVGSVVTMAAAPLIGLIFKSETVVTMLLSLALLLILDFPINFVIWVSHCREDFTTPLFLRAVEKLSLLAILGGALLLGIRGVAVFQISLLIGATLATLFATPLAIKFVSRASIEEVISSAKELINFGRFSLATLISSRLYKSSDLYIVTLFLGAHAAALYGTAARMGEYIEIPLQAVGDRIFPKISNLFNRGERVLASLEIKRALILMAIPTVAVSLMLLFFAQPLLLLLGGETYLEATSLVRVWGVFVLFRPIDRVIGITLDSLGVPQVNMFKTATSAGVNTVLDIVVLFVTGSMLLVAIVSLFTQIGAIWYGYCKVVSVAPEIKLKRDFSAEVVAVGGRDD